MWIVLHHDEFLGKSGGARKAGEVPASSRLKANASSRLEEEEGLLGTGGMVEGSTFSAERMITPPPSWGRLSSSWTNNVLCLGKIQQKSWILTYSNLLFLSLCVSVLGSFL